MPPYKSKPAKGQSPAQLNATTGSKKVAAKSKPSDDDDEEEEEDDDEEVDEDDGDEEMSDEDLDEDVDDIDEDVSLDEEDDDDDEEEADEVKNKATPKKQQANGKEVSNKAADKKTKQNVAVEKEATKKKPEQPSAEKVIIENRATAVGPLTPEEIQMFSDNFRAMSATSVFVGKLPPDATEEDLKKLHPAIRVVRRPVTRRGRPRTFAFLNFPNKETADRALKEMNAQGPVKVRGQEIVVSENGNGQCRPPGLVDRRKLKIYGCPKHVSKEEILEKLGCADVLLNDRDKGNAIEAVAVFRTSADAKKVLESQPTVTLNDAICALFFFNISHNVKQQERKKGRKQQIKQEVKERKARAKAKAEAQGGDANDSDEAEVDSDDNEDGSDSDREEKVVTPMKSAKTSLKHVAKPSNAAGDTVKAGKRQRQDDDDEDDDEDDDAGHEELEDGTPQMLKRKSNKKVSMKTPQKTPSRDSLQKKSPRKGTPFKHKGFTGKAQAKKMKTA